MTRPVTRSFSSQISPGRQENREAPQARQTQSPPPPEAAPSAARRTETPAGRAAASRLRSSQERETQIYAEKVNTAQTRYVTRYALRQFARGEGSSAAAGASASQDDVILMSHAQIHDPALNCIFPIRDPADPTKVHPDYADPTDPTRCAGGVEIKEAKFGNCARERLWQLANADPEFDVSQYGTKTDYLKALRGSAVDAIAATMRGEVPPASRRLKVVRLERHHCETDQEADALEGQFGVVMEDEDPERQPLLRHAAVAGLYAGCRLDSDAARASYAGIFGEELTGRVLGEYALDGENGKTTWAPYGGGNDMQFINSAFKPEDGGPMRVDEERVHGCFDFVRVRFIDRDGRERREEIPIVVQYRPVPSGKQFLVNYGPDYTLTPGPAGVAARPASPEVKIESAEEDDMQESANADVGEVITSDEEMEDEIVLDAAFAEPVPAQAASAEQAEGQQVAPRMTRRNAAVGEPAQAARAAEPASGVPGLTFRNNIWMVQVRDPSGARHLRRFKPSRFGGVDAALQAAKEAAERIRAGDIPPRLANTQPIRSKMENVTYRSSELRWKVTFSDSSGTTTHRYFGVRAYGSIDQAREAAETFCRRVEAGEPAPEPGATQAPPKSDVRGVSFVLKRNAWYVGGPNFHNRPRFFAVRAHGSIEAARAAAEAEARERRRLKEASEPDPAQ